MSKILVIEDNQDVRENIEEILELSGYDVNTANNGVEGVKAAKSEKPDLIICDIMMPELDGFGVLFAINKDPNLATVPFLFLTAKAEIQDRRKGMRMGADDYLTKPFDESDLLMTVENRIRKNEMLKESYVSEPEGIKELVQDSSGEKLTAESLIDKNWKEKYDAQQKLYSEGANARHIFYLHKGNVKISQGHPDGKELFTDIVEPGNFFGFIPVLLNEAHHTSAVTMSECEITTIPIEEFEQLISADSDFRNRLFKVLSGNIKERETEMLEIAYGTVRKRVAEGLVKIWIKAGEPEKLDMSREDVANFVGVATETLIRTLSDFKKEGLIRSEKRSIVIEDPEGLMGLKF